MANGQVKRVPTVEELLAQLDANGHAFDGLARVLGTYRRKLLGEGFSDEGATALAVALQQAFVGKVIG